MVKVSVQELEQALALIKKTSLDVYVLVREDGPRLNIQFQSVDSQITNIHIYGEDSKMFAKVTSSESLTHTLAKLKK